MHICVSKKKTLLGWDNGWSPRWHQAIIWTNAGTLLFQTLGKTFSEILSEIHTFSFTKMHWKMRSGWWRPFCFGLNVLMPTLTDHINAQTRKMPCVRADICYWHHIYDKWHRLLLLLWPVVWIGTSVDLRWADGMVISHWGFLMPYGDIDLGPHWLR